MTTETCICWEVDLLLNNTLIIYPFSFAQVPSHLDGANTTEGGFLLILGAYAPTFSGYNLINTTSVGIGYSGQVDT